MRSLWILVAMGEFWFGLAAIGLAGDNTAKDSPNDKKLEGSTKQEADTRGIEALRADIRQTLAELIEAQSAKQAAQTKIDRLTKNLHELRGKLASQPAASADNQPTASNCPWGGPGMGYGRNAGWGGPGRGFGGGRGPGYGRGFGPGGGMGRTPGGPAFVDEDKDGVCDQYEKRIDKHD
jgi:hypothetical protein